MGWCLEWQKKESKSSKKMRVDEVDIFLIINLAKDKEYLQRVSLLLKENYTCTCFFDRSYFLLQMIGARF
jgi:hypothetical protein